MLNSIGNLGTTESVKIQSSTKSSKSASSLSKDFASFLNASDMSDMSADTMSKSFKNSSEVGSYKTADTTSIKTADSSELSNKVKDTLDEKSDDIIKTVADDLDVSTEEIEDAMETLGLTAADLLDSKNLANLAANVKGLDKTSQLLLDGDFTNLLSDISQITQDMANELGIDTETFLEMTALTEDISEDMANVILEFDDVVQNMTDTESALSTSDVMTQNDETENLSTEDQVEELGELQDEDVVQIEVTGSTEKESSAGKEYLSQNGANQQFYSSSETLTQTVSSVQSTTSYSTTVDTLDIIRQITERISVTNTAEESTVEMQLNPENLGKIYINVSARNGEISANIAASNDAVREALEAQLINLRESLNQAGVKVDAVEVTVASHEFERNLEQNNSREESEGEQLEASNNARRRNLSMDSLDELSGLMTEEEQLAAAIMKDNGNSIDVTA